MAELWASGETYDQYVGRLSRQVADVFVPWLNAPAAARWADIGSGTGAVTSAILAHAAPQRVVAVDPSAAHIATAHTRIRDTRVEMRVGTLDDLHPASADAVVSGLVLNFLPDPAEAVDAMARIGAGGEVAAYVWDYADGMRPMRLLWDAARAVDPDAAELDEGERFPLCRREALEALWRASGLSRVRSRAIEVTARYDNADDYWSRFLTTSAPAPAYVQSLDPDRREALRRELLRRLPADGAGPFTLPARAWAVSGESWHPHADRHVPH